MTLPNVPENDIADSLANAGRRASIFWNNIDLPDRDQHRDRSEIRARHETVNGRMKNFLALKCVFRHDRSKHTLVFRAAAVIVQLTLKHEKPLFKLT